jgi:broad specificity phosphatase PhoE
VEKIDKENVLVVTHGDFIKMLISLIIFGEKVKPSTYIQLRSGFYIKNTGITECEYKNEKWKLITWNDANHAR